MRVVMAVTNDLVTDRRVLRHAEALREGGYEVECVGKRELGVRARRGWMFYAECNVRLLLWLLRRRMEIVWANDTDTLMGCYVATRVKNLCLRLRGAKGERVRLVMDAHELFPEVPELIGRERVKRVWEWIEKHMMQKCDARLTVCQSIADYYRKRYGVEMTVVRNVGKRKVESGEWKVESGKWKTESGEGKTESGEWKVENGKWKVESGEWEVERGKWMLLYQGAVNKGRGVDWAIDALEWLEDCELVVAGGGDLLEEMKDYAAGKPWAERIRFLGRLMPEELERLTAKASVGLVMLEDMGLSYHFALPNRIGDFVAAGVPMVVSDLPEMSRVVREYGVGEVIEKPRDERYETRVKGLAEAVERVLAREWTEADFEAARRDMDWEKEKRKLMEMVDKMRND